MQVYKFFFIASLFFLSSCLQERTEGMVLEQSYLNKLQINLTKEEVKNIMGSPSITLNQDNWVYASSKKTYRAFLKPKVVEQTVIDIFFANNRVTKIERYTKEDIPIKDLKFNTKI